MQSKKHTVVERPWGGYQILEKHTHFWLKKLFVEKKAELSLQSHKHRSEIWVVLEGTIRVQKGRAHRLLHTGESIIIKTGEKHRIEGVTKAVVLEAAFGTPKEKDIIRFEDKYGRVP